MNINMYDNLEEILNNTKKKKYPVIYQNKEWFKKDCDDLFVDFYHSPLALNPLGGVYLNGGLWVYPDGKLEEY